MSGGEAVDRDDVLADELVAARVPLLDLLEQRVAGLGDEEFGELELGAARRPAGEEFAVFGEVELFEIGADPLEIGHVDVFAHRLPVGGGLDPGGEDLRLDGIEAVDHFTQRPFGGDGGGRGGENCHLPSLP